ncbi:MAG: BTAD domain-containing putative transcriptional regulator, partial [Gaiellales bacterium]
SAPTLLQGHISQLRKLLEPERDPSSPPEVLLTRRPGYMLQTDPDAIDLHRFERLAAEGRAALVEGDAVAASRQLNDALGLWRGPPLTDLAYEPFAAGPIARLDELRLNAVEDRIEADLALGRHAELIAELEQLVNDHPLRERLRGQLMLALYRSGRQAEALDTYQTTRATLIDQLGIEPGPVLKELESGILNQDPALDLRVLTTESSAAASRAPSDADGPALLAADFVGREAQIAELNVGIEDAIAGCGRLFLISGEPGIGKTRLADQLAAEARARGMRVLVGRCWEAGGAPAYWPWIQSLRAYVRELDSEVLREQLGSGGGELAQIVPELRERVPGLPAPDNLEAEAARFRLFDSAASFLEAAAAAQPMLLVLDDLHTADAPSLLLLQFVVRSLGAMPMMILAAYRDVDPPLADPLAASLAELTREQTTSHVPLTGLSEAEVEQFIELSAGVRPSPSVKLAVHDETEGNPFFVGEVVRLLASQQLLGELEDRTAGALIIPDSVRQVIERRLQRLSDECRELLESASV